MIPQTKNFSMDGSNFGEVIYEPNRSYKVIKSLLRKEASTLISKKKQ
jgi:hypothetical protein